MKILKKEQCIILDTYQVYNIPERNMSEELLDFCDYYREPTFTEEATNLLLSSLKEGVWYGICNHNKYGYYILKNGWDDNAAPLCCRVNGSAIEFNTKLKRGNQKYITYYPPGFRKIKPQPYTWF